MLLDNAGVIFSSNYKETLQRADEMKRTGVSPRGESKKIMKRANYMKGRIRYFYQLLKNLLYDEQSLPSPESSQNCDEPEQQKRAQDFIHMRESYQVEIHHRDEIIHKLEEENEFLKQSRNDIDSLNAMLVETVLDDLMIEERIDDLYETHPSVVKPLLTTIYPYMNTCTLDPCSGRGMMSNYLISEGYNVICHDLFYIDTCKNFLVDDIPMETGFIICHPPIIQEELFLIRCFELKKPFAILISLNSLCKEVVSESIYKNDANIHFLVGKQTFIYEGQEKKMGHYVWVLGNMDSARNTYHIISHNWSHGIRCSSFDDNILDDNIEVDNVENIIVEDTEDEPTKNITRDVIPIEDDDDLVCSICWAILTDETIEFGENCAHPFCTDCWNDYHKATRTNRTCPVCRTLLKAKNKRGRPRKKSCK